MAHRAGWAEPGSNPAPSSHKSACVGPRGDEILGGSLGVMLRTPGQAQDSVLRDHGGVVRVMAWPWWGGSSES